MLLGWRFKLYGNRLMVIINGHHSADRRSNHRIARDDRVIVPCDDKVKFITLCKWANTINTNQRTADRQIGRLARRKKKCSSITNFARPDCCMPLMTPTLNCPFLFDDHDRFPDVLVLQLGCAGHAVAGDCTSYRTTFHVRRALAAMDSRKVAETLWETPDSGGRGRRKRGGRGGAGGVRPHRRRALRLQSS